MEESWNSLQSQPPGDKGFGNTITEAVERGSCEGEEGNSHGTYVRLVRMALWQRPTGYGCSSLRKDVNGTWHPWLFKPGPVLCVSVCSMLTWACVDENRTRLGDAGAGGEQRGNRLPHGRNRGHRGASGPEVGSGFSLLRWASSGHVASVGLSVKWG